MVYNLKKRPLSGAFRRGPYKIIFGQNFLKQGWYDTENTALRCRGQTKGRMEDCNWSDFSDQGHSQESNLIPRDALQVGDMVQITEALLNPFNISATDEDNEFEDDILGRIDLDEDQKLERKFGKVDIAMYNVMEDPEETNDLREEFPEILEELKERVLEHIKNIVPADFPDSEKSELSKEFSNTFSPGWCTAQ